MAESKNRKEAKYNPDKIFKLFDEWQSYVSESILRGEENARFVEKGQQQASYSSNTDIKESFSFNLSKKIQREAQANAKEIDISLKLNSPLCEVNQDEKKIASKIISKIMLDKDNVRNLNGDAIDKVYSHGFAVLHIKAVRENEESLNRIIRIENIQDIQNTFFDHSASSKYKHDGAFCGRKFVLKRKEFLKIYPDLENANIQDEVEVIDFWFKETKDADYLPLTSGVKIREDLFDDVRMAVDKSKKVTKSKVTRISYCRVVKGHNELIEKELMMPMKFLPMVIDPGETAWIDGKYESFPLGYDLYGSQVLLNYLLSSAAHIAKGLTGTKWLMSPIHVSSDEGRRNANEINDREGAFVFPGLEELPITEHPPQQIPTSMLNLIEQTIAVMNQIAGGYFDMGASQITATSGVALDKMMKRADLTQNNVIVNHLNTINIVGCIMKCMIPIYYHENRVVDICDVNGEESIIEINKPVEQPGGQIIIKNDISKICRNYNFKLDASPSLKMQKQNLQVMLGVLYSFYPEARPLTVDIYTKSMDVPNADVISKRLAANMPQELIDYGDGKISLPEYQRATAMKQQQQMQQQQQLMMSTPDSQYKQAQAKTQASKAQSEQYNAETSRLKEAAQAHTNETKGITEAVKIAVNSADGKLNREMEYMKAELAHLNALIREQGVRKG